MTEYRVRQGDCMARIAGRNGFLWEKLWDHPDNSDLKRLRQDPNVLFPGDVVIIPEKERRTVPGGTEERHRFQRHDRTALLRLELAGEDGEPWADVRYRLAIQTREMEGVTDGEGILEEEIPAGAEAGELTVWLPPRQPDAGEEIIRMDGEEGDLNEPPAAGTDPIPFVWQLAIGHLDPIEEVSGIQGRLHNLGYHPGPVDGNEGPATRAALERFQEARDLTVSGEADSETRSQLKEHHGC